MAIRPADLQLAYVAAPQNAAQVNAAENAANNAQQAAQASFAAQIAKREETVAEAEHAGGGRISTNADGRGSGEYTPQGRRQNAEPNDESLEGFEFAGDGEHFIDFTA
jgi:hypothetical protein